MALHRCFQPDRSEAEIANVVTDALVPIEQRNSTAIVVNSS